MIRVALLAMGFLAVTITLIVMQPSAPQLHTTLGEPVLLPVTRADTDFDALSDVTATFEDPTEPDGIAPDETPQTHAVPKTVEPDQIVAATPEVDATNLERLIVEALRQGQSDDYIDALVNHAAKRGEVEVPGSLITADGRVDTSTLLTVLSQAPDAMRSGARMYTVKPGDSLASISYRFFGTTDRATDIVVANSASMDTPNPITVGQDLIIPTP